MRKLGKSMGKRIVRTRRRLEGLVYERMRPTGVVLGAQKGGTTALYHYLSQHPQVVPSLQKEIHFFNNRRHFARGVDFYHSFFEHRTPVRADKISLDVTPGYLAAASVTAPRLFEYDSSLRLVALLRDPVTRGYSAWQMYRKYYSLDRDWFDGWQASYVEDAGSGPVRKRSGSFGNSFADDIREELEAMERGERIEMPFILQGRYARQIKTFYQSFPVEQLLVLSSEELKADTRANLYQLEEHFGLAHYPWRDEQIQPHFEGGYRERISDEARRLLADYYRPYNQELFALLGREFDWH